MKKLIHEVVQALVVISIACNPLATIASEIPKEQTQKITEEVKSPKLVPQTLTEKVLSALGFNVGSPEDKSGPKFSEVVLQHQLETLIKNKPNEVVTIPVTQKSANAPIYDLNKHDAAWYNKDGTMDLSEISPESILTGKSYQELKAPNMSIENIISSKQLLEVQRLSQIQSQAERTKGFYFPNSEKYYSLNLTAEEAAKMKAEYPKITFVADGVSGNTLKFKIKNPRSIENIFAHYKVQPELVKKFSPLMLENTLVNKFKDAGAHAATSFPMEAVTFYIGIYFNTLLNLTLKYNNDPAALEKFFHEVTSVPGQISFFAFMLGNRMFTNVVGPKVNAKLLKMIIPFIGMGIGSIASAFSHDVMTLTKSCAINMMKADEFNDEEKARTMNECEASYNQVVSSSNTHNYITSFMNILVAGAGAGIGTSLLAGTAKKAGQLTVKGSTMLAEKNGGKLAVNTALRLEGIAIEMNTIKSEMNAYGTLSKTLTKAGKATTSTRLASWFGFVAGKPGNLGRLAFSLGRWGWKIGGGIVIFLQADEMARPYTYHFEQQLLGSGRDLNKNLQRLDLQLKYLKNNKWTHTLCEVPTSVNPKTGIPTYTNDCKLDERTESITEQSKLWRDSILYHFMASYSNWLMYVENFHSQWNMAYTFYSQFLKYASSAKDANYDGSKISRFNPLVHDDYFQGVEISSRIEDKALSNYLTITDDLNFEGMNVARAQRVIDLLPLIGAKLKEIRAKDFKHKDWKGVDATLTKIAKYISAYMTLDARSKGSSLKGLDIVKDHFSKKSLEARDVPALKDYDTLIAVIDILNKSFEDYKSAYKSVKGAVTSRDMSIQEAQYKVSLYDKVILFKTLREFLGNPRPSARGESFIRSFDEYAKTAFTEDQIKTVSRNTGSLGKSLLWNMMCAKDFLQTADIKNTQAAAAVSSSSWGKNVNFIFPRVIENPDLNNCKDYEKLIPTRGNSNKKFAMDYLMRNVSDKVLDSEGTNFDAIWENSIVPKIAEVYKKFDLSYRLLLQEQFYPKYLGKNGSKLVANALPESPIVPTISIFDAYKQIKGQSRALMGIQGGSVIQTYVDQMDVYLQIMKSTFESSLEQDYRLMLSKTTNMVTIAKYNEQLKLRNRNFNILLSQFRNAFTKIILSIGVDSAEIDRDYAGMLVTYLHLNKSLGIANDIKLETKNEELGDEVVTKVVGSISRSQTAEGIIYKNIMTDPKKMKTLKSSVESQMASMGMRDENSRMAFTQAYLANMIDSGFLGQMKTRLENDPEIRDHFVEIKNILEEKNAAYSPNLINMSLPNGNSSAQHAYSYTAAEKIFENQFLGVLGASQGLDTLMEEVYFNVNILKAANIDNKYRNIEKEKLQKFQIKTMRGM